MNAIHEHCSGDINDGTYTIVLAAFCIFFIVFDSCAGVMSFIFFLNRVRSFVIASGSSKKWIQMKSWDSIFAISVRRIRSTTGPYDCLGNYVVFTFVLARCDTKSKACLSRGLMTFSSKKLAIFSNSKRIAGKREKCSPAVSWQISLNFFIKASIVANGLVTIGQVISGSEHIRNCNCIITDRFPLQMVLESLPVSVKHFW